LRAPAAPWRFAGVSRQPFLPSAISPRPDGLRKPCRRAVSLLAVAQARRSASFLPADAAILVSFLDVFGLAFLFAAIAGFVAARHNRPPQRCGCQTSQRVSARPVRAFCEPQPPFRRRMIEIGYLT